MLSIRSLACLLLLCSAIAQAEDPTSPPPASMTGTAAIWVPGCWVWTGAQWSWHQGSWQVSHDQKSPIWIAGYWSTGATGTFWVPGHYQGATDDTVAIVAPPPTEVVYVEEPVVTRTVVTEPVCAPGVSVGVYVSGPPVIVRPPLLPLPLLRAPIAAIHHGGSWLPLRLLDPLFFLHRH
jgi:hypothetical protein